MRLARTKIPVPIEEQNGYTSCIVSFSTGIDSTGVLYWAINNFPRKKIFLLYCDTGAEYPINDELFYRAAKQFNITPVLLRHPKGFLGLLLEERKMFPDSKNRWCTAYLKTGVTDKWIRKNRSILGRKCLFVSGERKDESIGRSKLPEWEYHSTTLKTTRIADFQCHWYRPCLNYEKGRMFEWGRELGIEPHPCYEYIDRCSCFMCIFAKDSKVIENIKRHPDLIKRFITAEQKLGHTWKSKRSLEELWEQCHDIDNVEKGKAKAVPFQLSFFQ
jgi:3'-phosphoadenosine 5'-phosphosulfate sulfotransferase (PAPS reductase)/FAD synthetase